MGAWIEGTVRAGASPIELRLAEGFIEGVLLDEHGRPAPGFAVGVRGCCAVSAGADGRFRLVNLKPGRTYEVRATGPTEDGDWEEITVEDVPTGTTDLRVQFR